MKRVVFGITSLTLGGAEKVLVDLANALVNNYEITVLTLYPKGEFETQLHPKIQRKTLYKKTYQEMSKFEKLRISFQLLFCKKYLYKKFLKDKYDVEIAFLEGPITRLFSVPNKSVKKVAWVHTNIARIFGNDWKACKKRRYDEKIYRSYEQIVFVSEDSKKAFEAVYPFIREEKLKVIYNYIEQQKVLEMAKEAPEITFQSEEPNLVIVARLTKEKALERFIYVHLNLLKKGIYHQVYVIGEGPEEEALKELVETTNLTQSFHLLGKKENPYPYLKQADIVVLPSYYEGYGMVLEEAKILDKYIIITNTGAREAVQGYSKSLVVENSEKGLQEGIQEVITQKIYQKEEKTKKYSNDSIIQEVKKLIGE